VQGFGGDKFGKREIRPLLDTQRAETPVGITRHRREKKVTRQFQ
jgi:hypothetical protein